jgi:hypothetical protein
MLFRPVLYFLSQRFAEPKFEIQNYVGHIISQDVICDSYIVPLKPV